MITNTQLQNDLTFLRIKSKRHEILVAPGKLSQSFPRDMAVQDACMRIRPVQVHKLRRSIDGRMLCNVFFSMFFRRRIPSQRYPRSFGHLRPQVRRFECQLKTEHINRDRVQQTYKGCSCLRAVCRL